MWRAYTPVVFYISPRVTYYTSTTTIALDTKNTMNLIQDLDSDELPFINFKIGNNLIEFDESLYGSRGFSSRTYTRDYIRGRIGENLIEKKQDLTMQWETGRAMISHQESTFCNFDQSDCYQAKSVPVIFDVSDNKSYKTGGHNITVYGYGFDSGKIDAKIDGKACEVNSFTRYQFTCKVKESPQISDLTKKYVGQHGISKKFVNLTEKVDINKLESYDGQMKLSLNLESEVNYGTYLGNLYKGWFIPPADTRYRFYVTCDDICRLSLAPCPDTTEPL